MVLHKDRDPSVHTDNITQLNVNTNTIHLVFKFKYLGVWLDPSLNFNQHYKSVTERVSNKLKILHGVKRFISECVMPIMINAYIHSIIDFAIEIWCVQSDRMLDQLQKIIDSFLISYFLPSIYKKNKKHKLNRSEVDPQHLRDKCNFLTVKERLYVTLKTTYKNLNTNKNFLAEKTQYNNSTFPRARRMIQGWEGHFGTHISQNFKKSFSYRSSSTWNRLPKDWALNDLSYDMFKENILKWLVSKRNDQFVYY